MSNSDDDGFVRFVVPELEVLTRVSRRIAANPIDAEDLVQETLLRAYRSIASFDGRYPRAWLLVIMRNAHKNLGRRPRPALLRDPDVALALAVNRAPDAATPESVVLDKVFDAAIERSFNAMPSQFQAAVQLVDVEGLTHPEAAAFLDVPVGTVMSRVHRGRKLIRQHLADDPMHDVTSG